MINKIKLFFISLISTFSFSNEYEITVLATNISNYGGFGEWSFSALYENNDESILFDTGFHEDTTGGLIKLRQTYKKINPKSFSKVYVARGFFEQRYLENGQKVGPGNFDDSNEFKIAAEKEGIDFIILDNHFLVSRNLYATGTVERTDEYFNGPKGIYTDVELTKPDIIKDDQSVGMLTDKGWVMMSGCGHSGIINTAKKLQSIKNVPVYGAIGGFHLFRADDETIINTANWFKDNGLTKFMGGHCTGIHAANEIANIIGIKREDLSHTAVGSILTKDLNIIRSSVE